MGKVIWFLLSYVWIVFGNLWGLLLLMAGLVDLYERFFERQRPKVPVAWRVGILVGVVIVAQVAAYKELSDKTEQGRQGSNIATHVEFRNFTVGRSIFSAGERVEVNLQHLNTGPFRAEDMTSYTQLRILEPSEETTAYAEFKNRASSDVNAPKRDLNVGHLSWGTFGTEPLFDSDVIDLKAGTRRLYIFSTAKWRDEAGLNDLEFCMYVQAPGDAAIFHYCDAGHNKTRIVK